MHTAGACTLNDMNKIRLVLVVEEEVRDVLKIEAGFKGSKGKMSEIVARLIRDSFPEILKQVRARRAKEKKNSKDASAD